MIAVNQSLSTTKHAEEMSVVWAQLKEELAAIGVARTKHVVEMGAVTTKPEEYSSKGRVLRSEIDHDSISCPCAEVPCVLRGRAMWVRCIGRAYCGQRSPPDI